MHLVRGARLLTAIDEDSTVPQLRQNIEQNFDTNKRQHATGTVSIQGVQFVPFQPEQQMKVLSQTRSNGHNYNTACQFSNVAFQEAPSAQTVTVMGKDGAQHNIVPVVLNTSNVQVSCTCLDFHYRFSAWNATDDSLAGQPPGLYRKTTNRPPVNPSRVPGMCKHIIKLVDHLRRLRVVR
jgi:hypothetical protein